MIKENNLCFSDDKRVLISADENVKEIIIPKECTEIAKGFKCAKDITRVIFEGDYCNIAPLCFINCKNLEEVVLPKHMCIFNLSCFMNTCIKDLTFSKEVGAIYENHKLISLFQNAQIENVHITGEFPDIPIKAKKFFIEKESSCVQIDDEIYEERDGRNVLVHVQPFKTKISKNFEKADEIAPFAFFGCTLDELFVENQDLSEFAFAGLNIDYLSINNQTFYNSLFSGATIKNLEINNSIISRGVFFNSHIDAMQIFNCEDYELTDDYLKCGDELVYVFPSDSEHLTIPSDISFVHLHAFLNSNHKTVTFDTKQMLYLSKLCFSKNKFIEKVFINSNCYIDKDAFSNTPNLKDIYFKDNIYIDAEAFMDSSIEKLCLPGIFKCEHDTFNLSNVKKIYITKESFEKMPPKELGGIEVIVDDDLATRKIDKAVEGAKSFKEINNLYNEFGR